MYSFAQASIHENEARVMLEPLMRYNLTLEKRNLGAGEGKYRHFFLCANVDLPWDPAQLEQ